MAFGTRTLQRSTAMWRVTLPRSFWRLLRSRGRPYRSWSGTGSWLLHRSTPEISWTAERITIRRSRFTMPPSIVRWRLGSVKTSEWSILSLRSTPLWMLGYPEAALADVDQALKDAREIGHAASLMYALAMTSLLHLLRRKLCSSKRAS